MLTLKDGTRLEQLSTKTQAKKILKSGKDVYLFLRAGCYGDLFGKIIVSKLEDLDTGIQNVQFTRLGNLVITGSFAPKVVYYKIKEDDRTI